MCNKHILSILLCFWGSFYDQIVSFLFLHLNFDITQEQNIFLFLQNFVFQIGQEN